MSFRWIWPVVSYFLGAVPFGVLISRTFYHINIREHGSKNTGATNVWRVLGPVPGITTLLLDAIKGIVPVTVYRLVRPDDINGAIICGLAAIVGHNWSLFLRGKGGKGVATSAGVFLALMPLQALFAVAAFLVFFLYTKHVSVGSMAGALALLLATFFIPSSAILRGVVLVASVMILIKHIPNMRRLARGEEPKVKFP